MSTCGDENDVLLMFSAPLNYNTAINKVHARNPNTCIQFEVMHIEIRFKRT